MPAMPFAPPGFDGTTAMPPYMPAFAGLHFGGPYFYSQPFFNPSPVEPDSVKDMVKKQVWVLEDSTQFCTFLVDTFPFLSNLKSYWEYSWALATQYQQYINAIQYSLYIDTLCKLLPF